MKKQSNALIRMSAIALAITALSGPALAESTMAQDLTNARQESQIWTTYALSPYLPRWISVCLSKMARRFLPALWTKMLISSWQSKLRLALMA